MKNELCMHVSISLLKTFTMMENKYKNGEVVVERIRPNQKLVVCSYVNGVYCCKSQEASTQRGLVYFERDLRAEGMLHENPNRVMSL